MNQAWRPLADDLFVFNDTCNVYLLRYGDRALAVDYGSGAWLPRLREIGVRALEHVVLTHAHRDQVQGLVGLEKAGFEVHAPAGDAELLEPGAVERFWLEYQANGCPPSYSAPRAPVPLARAHLRPDGETRLGPLRLCALGTPGHSRGALSYLVEWRGRAWAFCGDAFHAGGTLHQPYHLEWDHWTPSGALAAWYGLERLSYCRFDGLLPSHGPPVLTRPLKELRLLQRRLMAFVRAKGSVCAGAPNRWLDCEEMPDNARKVSPSLYQFGGNGYLLLDGKGGALVVDPTLGDLPALERLLERIGPLDLRTATATHYHVDHSDALNRVRQRHGAAVWLHPWVAAPLKDRDSADLPWLPAESVRPDRVLPEEGHFRWGPYRFALRPFPGQTRWHCAFDAAIDGRQVLFSGDNFQPPSRWNGTGGFCSFNGSRFADGFARSAHSALEAAPDIVCNGHGCIYPFSAGHYRRILRWSAAAEKAVADLCPAPEWLADYDCRAARWEPFVHRAAPGGKIELSLVYTNHTRQAVKLEAVLAPPHGWRGRRQARHCTVPPAASRTLRFVLGVGRAAAAGRHLLAAEIALNGHAAGEACVAVVDIGRPGTKPKKKRKKA